MEADLHDSSINLEEGKRRLPKEDSKSAEHDGKVGTHILAW
jgi:hypothetical protein